MKHTSQSTMQSCNPATLSQSDKDALFRSIFDGNGGRTLHGNTAFDAVADGLSTYGRATHVNWDYDAAAAKQQGNKAARPLSKAERRDKRQSASWVRDFVPATIRPDYPSAKQDRNVGVVAAGSQDRKRFRVEITQPNGETAEILCSLITNTIHVLSYGKIVEFRCTSRANGTFLDCRDGKRKPLSFAKSELHRFVGLTKGDELFAELTTFPKGKKPATSDTMSPCNPAPKEPVTQQPGHIVAGLQKRVPTLWEMRKAARRTA
jgi:hypothetical protein